MLIIGIAGGTGSGKTTVVKKIIESLPPGEVVLLPQDSYYKDNSHVPVEKRQYINFDHPDAFDWPLLSEQVTLLKEGKCIEQPTYSYLTCCRLPETIHIEPRDVVIIEGILALCDPQLRDLMDLKVFVDTDSDERLIRVIQRECLDVSILRNVFRSPCSFGEIFAGTGYDRERTHGGSGNGTLYPGTKAYAPAIYRA